MTTGNPNEDTPTPFPGGLTVRGFPVLTTEDFEPPNDVLYVPASEAGTDISSRWSDYIDEANEFGSTIVIPRGEFTVPKKNVGAAGSYRVPHITGEYFSGHYTDPASYGSVLKLKDDEDGTLFTVAASDASDVGPGPFTVENLLIDMNRTHQAGTGYCVDFSNHTASVNKQRSGFFRRCYIKDVQTSGIRIGTLRNAGLLDQVTILGCGTGAAGSALQFGSCNDWWIQDCNFGVTLGAAVQDSGAGSIFYVNCNFFIGGTHGYKGDTSSLDHYFINCSFDTNARDGVNIGTSGDYPWLFSNCRFQQNSYSANDTYAHVNVAGNTLVGVSNCGFFPGSTNNPKYAAQMSAGGVITLTTPIVKSGAYVTALTNSISSLFGLIGPKPTITGSRGGNAALADLLIKMVAMGLITDGTS